MLNHSVPAFRTDSYSRRSNARGPDHRPSKRRLCFLLNRLCSIEQRSHRVDTRATRLRPARLPLRPETIHAPLCSSQSIANTLGHAGPRVVFSLPASSVSAHLGARRRILQQAQKRLCQPRTIFRRNHVAGLRIANQLGHRKRVRSNARQSMRLSFENGDSERLP